MISIKPGGNIMRDNLKILLQKLLNHNVDFVLAGGLACTVHGSPLVTQDIDICVAINDTQLLKLREALRDVTPRFRMNPNFKPSFLEHPKRGDELKNIYLETDLGVLDIISELQPVGAFEIVKQRSITIKLYGHPCHVVCLEDLIRIKETMSRPKDKETLLHLRAILKKLKPDSDPE
jgi:predicted nucleotidyltransferase